jgi:hypothetical protein
VQVRKIRLLELAVYEKISGQTSLSIAPTVRACPKRGGGSADAGSEPGAPLRLENLFTCCDDL